MISAFTSTLGRITRTNLRSPCRVWRASIASRMRACKLKREAYTHLSISGFCVRRLAPSSLRVRHTRNYRRRKAFSCVCLASNRKLQCKRWPFSRLGLLPKHGETFTYQSSSFGSSNSIEQFGKVNSNCHCPSIDISVRRRYKISKCVSALNFSTESSVNGLWDSHNIFNSGSAGKYSNPWPFN